MSSDGSVLASGQSVIELAPDGRICRMVTFWEALPPIPIPGPSISLCQFKVKPRMRPNLYMHPRLIAGVVVDGK